jgi:outer membrane protein assembly factor BamB
MEPLQADDPRSVGEFRLRARLGAGGMGRVFLGYSPAGRAVAVKVCHPEFAADPGFVRRFALEVAAARAVNGLYTAQVIDAGPDDNPPWLATSYVPGPSLYDAVEADGPLPEQAVWRLAAGLAEALQAVHARGLVHRDLKPTNVLLAADGPRVIDFGIARALDGASLTTTGIAFGTPAYMSPEQAEGRPAGPASDVFALGCVLCFAATGDVPFGDGDAPAVLYRVVHSPPALEAIPDGFRGSGGLRGLVAACLAKNPEHRPTLPQVLGACHDHAVAPPGPAAAFWPPQLQARIAEHQISLDGSTPPAETDGPPTHVGTWRLSNPHPGTLPPAARMPAGLSRRRALAGVAGVAGAGLATAGWALTRSGAAKPPALGSGQDRLIWAHRTGGPVSSGAAITGGLICIGSNDQHVYVLHAATGRLVRRHATGGAVAGAVTIADDAIFAGSADAKVYRFPLAPGGPAWSFPTHAAVRCKPLVAGGAVYIGSTDHSVYALAASSGARNWHFPTEGAVLSGPLPGDAGPDDDRIYVGSLDGHMYALNSGSGHVDWKFRAGGKVSAGALEVSAAIYAGDEDGNLFQVRALGDGGWRFAGGGAIRGTPVAEGESIYIGSASSHIYAVDAAAGGLIWSFPTAGPVNSGLAIANNVLYAGDEAGYVYAIDVGSQRMLWRYKTAGPVRSQLLVADGVVYFGSADHHVHAVRA